MSTTKQPEGDEMSKPMGVMFDLGSVLAKAQRDSMAVAAQLDEAGRAEAERSNKARVEAREQAAAARQAAQRETSLETIPARFGWARFGAKWPSSVDADAVRQLEARGGREGKGATPLLTLHGPSGSGKTSVAVALMRARLTVSPRPVGLFVTAVELVAVTKATPLGQAVELVERAKRAPVLVLDDMGQEPSGEWNRVVVEVLHERHAHQLWTVVTTFYDLRDGSADLAKVSDRYGGGLLRRLNECRKVGFRGGR